MFTTEQQATGAGILAVLAVRDRNLREHIDRPVLNLVDEGINVSRLPSLTRNNPLLSQTLLASARSPRSLTDTLRPLGKADRLSLRNRTVGSLLLGIPAYGAIASLGGGVYNGLLGGDKERTAQDIATGVGTGAGLLLGAYGATKAFDATSKLTPSLGRSANSRLMSRYTAPLIAAGTVGFAGVSLGAAVRRKLKEKLLGPEASQGVTLEDLGDASPSTLNLG